MRLLHLDEVGNLRMTQFFDNVLPYAILSHTWRPDGGEVSFKDIAEGTARNKAGYTKIAFCGETAASHGLKHFWVDTCCIDKSSSSELQESINRMFSWYRGATRCYAYLADVSAGDYDLSNYSHQSSLNAAFRASRWFKRGWTLQELIAPPSVEFYSQDGKRLGDKTSLERQIHDITGIPASALQGTPLSEFSVEARYRWAKGRQTTREEDYVYSLLGIFDVFIPLLYGEGRDKALLRLMREVHSSRGRSVLSSFRSALTNAGSGNATSAVSKRKWIEFAEAEAQNETARLAIGASAPKIEEPNSSPKLRDRQSRPSGTTRQRGGDPAAGLGASSREVQTFDSVQSWIGSFHLRNSDSTTTSGDDFATRFSKFKQKMVEEGALPALSSSEETSNASVLLTTDQVIKAWPTHTGKRQPVPSGLDSLVKRSLGNDEIHLIIQGLGPDGTEVRDQIFPRSSTVNDVFRYLEREGFDPVSALRVHSGVDEHYDVERKKEKTSVIPVEITDGLSCHVLKDRYRINENERLIDFYNMRFEEAEQVRVVAHMDYIEVVDQYDKGSNIYIDFKRTFRVPDDDKTYELPPPQANLPLFQARHFPSTIPEAMQQKGGFFFPLLQREAFMLAFTSPSPSKSQFAIRIFTGAVNAITGEAVLERSAETSVQLQDYVLAPDQGLLSGYQAGDSLKQFVAMPMSDRYTLEYQRTGGEFVGGIQLELIPRLQQSATFWLTVPSSAGPDVDNQTNIDLYATPKSLGLRPGQRIFMKDHHAKTLYSSRSEDWEPAKDFVEPSAFRVDRDSTMRQTLVAELFDGPSFLRLDPSSSLVLTAVNSIRMTLSRIENTPVSLTFDCSQLARMSDIRDFIDRHLAYLVPHINVRRRDNEMTLLIAGQSYGSRDDPLIQDLRLKSPQTIRVKDISLRPINREVGVEDISLCSINGGVRGGGSYSTEKPAVAGWDMGVAVGGRINQRITEDKSPAMWNWRAARTVNIQILNTVAFQAVTGFPIPFSNFPLVYPFSKSTPAIPEPARFDKSTRQLGSLSVVKSVSEIDSERGSVLGVSFVGDAIIVCVCCERRICDSVMDPCGHMFCQVCIVCYMAQSGTVHCVYCFTRATRVVRISAGAEAPGASSQDEAHFTYMFKFLPESSDGKVTNEQITDLILNRYSAMLQFIVGELIDRPDLAKGLSIGGLVKKALEKRNQDAWRILAALYRLTDHKGLQYAQEFDLDIVTVLNELGNARRINLDTAASDIGITKANLFVKLDIFSVDLSPRHVRHVAHYAPGELKLLLSLGTDPASADTDGETALHLAHSREAASVLCEAGAPIGALDGDKNTPIGKAVAYGWKDVLEVLLQQDGARELLDRRNKFGKAAVHYAKNKPDLLEMLVEAGANPDLEIGPSEC